MCLIIKYLQLYLHFVSFRFVSVLLLRFVCIAWTCQKTLLFWPLFWPSRAFSCRLCVFVCSNTKGRYFGRFCASIFDAPPAPYRPPPRPRLPFRIIFFIFFLFLSQPSVCQPSKFFFVIFFSHFIWLPTHILLVMLFMFLKMRRCFIWLPFDTLASPLNLKPLFLFAE